MANTKIPSELVAINAISGTLIADNAITSVHIAENNITATQIAINAVTALQMADGTITSAKIADGTIVTADIADGQITTVKIADSSVTTAKIAAGTILGGDIANNAILTQHIDDNQITADQIADNAVGLGQLASMARGKIIVGDSAGNPALLALGAANTLLQSDGTDLVFAPLQSGIDDNSNAVAITIDSSENVMIGKTSTSFTTAGIELATGGVAGKVQIQRASSPLTLVNLTDDGGILNFYKGTSVVGSIGTKSGGLYMGSDDAGIFFNHHGSGALDAILPYDIGQSSFYDGHVNLGASGGRFKDLYLSGTISSGGITATSSGNDQIHLKGTDTNATAILMDYNGTGSTDRVRIYNNAGGFQFLTENGDEKLSIAKTTGNATFTGTISSGAITSSGDIKTTGDVEIASSQPRLHLDRGDGSYSWSIYNGNGSGSFPLSTFNIANNAGTAVITALDNGNVGIGATAPSTPLHVRYSSAPNSGGNRNTVEDVLTLEATGYFPYGGYGMGINFQGEDYGNSSIRDYGKIQAVMRGHSSQNAAGDPSFSSDLAFWTNTGGASNTVSTEKMRITSAGNVGIGIISPYSKLNVEGTSASTYTGSGPGATIRASQSTDGNWIASDVDGKFAYFGVDGNDGKFAAYNYASSTEMGIVLGQNRVRIDNTGRVGINRTPSIGNSKLEIGGADDVRLIVVEASGHTGGMGIKGGTGADKGLKLFSGGQIKIQLSDQTNVAYTADGLFSGNARPSRYKCSSGGEMVLGYRDHGSGLYQGSMGLSYDNIDGLGNTAYRDAFVLKETSNGGQEHFRINGNGNVTNTNNSYGQISDQRLKTDIVDASSQWNDIKAVKVRKFKFGTAPEGHDFLQIGVISQELESAGMGGLIEESDPDEAQLAFNPELVGERVKTVKYSVLYMKAIKALQEAMTRIETLEARVTELE